MKVHVRLIVPLLSSDADYSKFQAPIDFHNGVAAVRINITDDSVGEYEEVFRVLLGNSFDLLDVATVHIISDDGKFF